MFFKPARHGGCGGFANRAPFRHAPALWLAALALAWLAVSPARAEGMYRCVGHSGEIVFSSSRAGYHHCHAMHLAMPRAPAAAAGPAADAQPPAAAASVTRTQPAPVYRQGSATRAPRLPADQVPDGAHILRGAVYKVVHADGSIEYTNVRPRGRHARGMRMSTLFTYISTCMACNVHSRIDWSHVPLRLHVYAPTIRSASARYGVDPALVRAVIHAESAFNPRAVSAKGAQGLMQLTPATASSLGVKDVFDARDNIRGGARYLAQLLKTFHGDERLAAAAYNAGPDAVQKYGGVPPYAETEVYVRRVALLHRRYRKALDANAAPPVVARGGAAGHAD